MTWAIILAGALAIAQFVLIAFGRQIDCWFASKRAGISYAEAQEILRRFRRSQE